MGFSKASDTLNQKVFFGKLEPYDLDPESSSFFCKVALPNDTNAYEQVMLLVTFKV